MSIETWLSKYIKNKFVRDVVEILIYVALGYLIAIGANKALGTALSTEYPVVAIVSKSMEHHDPATYTQWYLNANYTQEQIEKWPFPNGMAKGDIVIVKGSHVTEIKPGDVVVYKFSGREPIIHRVTRIENNALYTKGDNNWMTDQEFRSTNPITDKELKGKALFRIPLLGWVKIIFLEVVNFIR